MEIVPLADVDESFEGRMNESYAAFADREGVPVHTGLFVPDVNALPVEPWERTGQRGALVNLYGMEGFDDLQLHEIAPGEETRRQQHFYEEIVYVTGGHGATTIGTEGRETTFEWTDQSLFFIPKNVPYKHVNMSGEAPARLVSQTTLPLLLNVVDDIEFVFDCEYSFWDRFADEDYYSAEGDTGLMYAEKYDGGGPITWESNFVPDVTTFDTMESVGRFSGTRVVFFPFSRSSSTMFAHLAEFPVGRYNPAHRHGPGANVFIKSGEEGYSLLWDDDWDRKIKLDWGERSVFTPPAGWYHHHFNLTDEPTGHLALHSPVVGTLKDGGIFDAHDPDNIISHVEEDPATPELFRRELAARGLEFDMPSECYTDPDFSFEAE